MKKHYYIIAGLALAFLAYRAKTTPGATSNGQPAWSKTPGPMLPTLNASGTAATMQPSAYQGG